MTILNKWTSSFPHHGMLSLLIQLFPCEFHVSPITCLAASLSGALASGNVTSTFFFANFGTSTIIHVVMDCASRHVDTWPGLQNMSLTKCNSSCELVLWLLQSDHPSCLLCPALLLVCCPCGPHCSYWHLFLCCTPVISLNSLALVSTMMSFLFVNACSYRTNLLLLLLWHFLQPCCSLSVNTHCSSVDLFVVWTHCNRPLCQIFSFS